MKKIIIALIAVMFVFIGCENNNSIIDPNITSSIEPNVLITNENPLYEVMSIALEDTIFVQKRLSRKLTVDGSKGGRVSIMYKYRSTDSTLSKLTATLTIPKDAYQGELTFDMIFDLESYALELYPSPFTFDNPVILDMSFQGIDLSWFDINNFTFDYLDGEPTHMSFDKVEYDEIENKLTIKGAQIPHFSRYGWTRTTK